jgi:hypothetical protein
MNNFFSGSKPDLISMKSMNDLVDIVVEGGSNAIIGQVGEQGIENIQNIIQNTNKSTPFNLKDIFQNYIRPNLLPIIIILVFFLFVFFRYYTVQEEKFNPGEPIDSQINRNSYVDVNIPVLYDVEKITNMSEDEMIKKMKKKSVPFESSPKTDNTCYGKQKETREEVIYGSNQWANQDDGIPNPYYDNDYVTSTAEAVHFNNTLNKQSLDSAAKMIFN